MSTFTRKLDYISKLEQLANETKQNWWKELLQLWRPSGMEAGETGLRLAVRDNYINFYRKGQSVARVQVGRDRAPHASVHLKYLADAGLLAKAKAGDTKRREYAEIEGQTFTSKVPVPLPAYGKITFAQIAKNTRAWAGKEKHFVDLAVADNPGVIDLEVGLPRIEGLDGAPRMDLALLAPGNAKGTIELRFWEAKTIDDSRLCAESADRIEVAKQIKCYEDYFKNKDEYDNAVAQYRRVCQVLVKLSEMATRCGNPVKLSPLVQAVADDSAKLVVVAKPRLVVFQGQIENKGEMIEVLPVSTWKDHEARLRDQLKIIVPPPLDARPYALDR